MQEMIVLGEIPGTSTQLDFTQWALTSVVILLGVLFALSYHDVRHLLHRTATLERTKRILSLYRKPWPLP